MLCLGGMQVVFSSCLRGRRAIRPPSPLLIFRLNAALVTLAFASVVTSLLCPRSSRPTSPNGPRLVQPQQPFTWSSSYLWPNFHFLLVSMLFSTSLSLQSHTKHSHDKIATGKRKAMPGPCPFQQPRHRIKSKIIILPHHAFCSGLCIRHSAPLLAFILHPMHALYTYLTSWSLCQSLLALLSHLPFTGARRHPCLRILRLFLLSLLPPFLFPYIYLHTPRPPCFAATPRGKQASSAFCCRRLLPLPWACVRGERDEACM